MHGSPTRWPEIILLACYKVSIFLITALQLKEIKFDATEVVVLESFNDNVERSQKRDDGWWYLGCRRARKLQRSGGYKAVSDAI